MYFSVIFFFVFFYLDIPSPPRVKTESGVLGFWRCLCEGSLKKEVVSTNVDEVNEMNENEPFWLHLRNDKPIFWLGEPLLGEFLYVRRCYIELCQIVKQIWDSNNWMLILGSPG